ncbi:MAG: LON peptidase substrate-binding domain-containing protein [Mycobacterium sp.]
MFPLQTAMVPGELLPLRIFEPRYSAMVRHCLETDQPLFGVVLIARGNEVGGGDTRNDVGVLARIAEYTETSEGRYSLRCETGERIRVTQWLDDEPYPLADVEIWPDEPGGPVPDSRIDEIERRLVAVFQRVAEARHASLAPDALELSGGITGDPALRMYAMAARIPMGPADKYAVLSAPSAEARYAALSDAIDSVIAVIEFQLSEE